ncbi:MAG: sialidase [Vicinamibacteria bacterium]|nr:sialidase [Vicinamibacteria bacterium]
MRPLKTLAHFGLALTFTLTATSVLAQRGRGFGQPDTLTWRFFGPAVGNRIASIAGIPGDPTTYYAGAASGGVWKTTDGGERWTPVFDSQPVQAIGALAVSLADTSVVWAGTGEAWAVRDSDVMGDGVYKSTDAGKTWTHTGLTETGRIARIVTHPTNPDVAYVCATGRTTGPQQERGVFRTVDGGKNWEQVLFVDKNTGCSGLDMDAKNPRKLIAGTWQVEMHPWAMFSGGPGSGIFISTDAGSTWTRVENPGLPKSPLGKIDVAIAPSDSNRVYALIQTADQGSVWRSDDGGTNWRAINHDRALIGRAGYYIHLSVSSDNRDEIYVADSSFWVSVDGGETFREGPMGGDTHDIWVDPKDGDRYVVTHDGGLNITTQRARSSKRVTLPIGQMYHVAVDNDVPYRIYSNMQDNGTMRGRVDQPEGPFSFGRSNVWDHYLGGCESGFTIPDPKNSDIVYATCYGNKVTRWEARTGRARSIAPSLISLDSPPNDAKYRCHWSAPIAVDPFDTNNVLYGCQLILKTSNGGQSWKELSPDLSTQDPSRVVPSGGIVGDNLGQFYGEVVFAIAFSEVQQGLIWAGTNDGKMWNSWDGGATWNDLTKALTTVGMAAWGMVSKIEPSHHDAGTAYIAVARHLMDDREPYIYKTADFGKSWTRVSGDLPSKHPLSYVRAIAESPTRKGLLYAGTGHGFYYSVDDGAHWTQLQTGLPAAPVTWIATQKNFHDVVISTYGRGLYVLDDVTVLEQAATVAAQTSTPMLAKPRAAYRMGQQGQAPITWTQSSASPAKVEVLTPSGEVVREITRPGRPGINRTSWDLRYASPRVVALRTTPAENPHIWEEPRFRGRDTRPVTHWGLNQAQVGPIVSPGTYTVRLTVGGQTYTETLDVRRDPKVDTSDADFDLSEKTQLRIREDINQTSDIINHIEIMRKQLEVLQASSRGVRGREDIGKAALDLNVKMQAVEEKLLERAQWTSDDKYFQQAYRIYMNLIWLNGEVGPGAGDVAGGADFRPTDTSIQLLAELEQKLAASKAEYEALLSTEVAAFNRMMTEKNAPVVK